MRFLWQFDLEDETFTVMVEANNWGKFKVYLNNRLIHSRTIFVFIGDMYKFAINQHNLVIRMNTLGNTSLLLDGKVISRVDSSESLQPSVPKLKIEGKGDSPSSNTINQPPKSKKARKIGPSDGRVKSLRRQLEIYQQNLNDLEEQQASYGVIEVPVKLRNEIRETKRKISEIKIELTELKTTNDQLGSEVS